MKRPFDCRPMNPAFASLWPMSAFKRATAPKLRRVLEAALKMAPDHRGAEALLESLDP